MSLSSVPSPPGSTRAFFGITSFRPRCRPRCSLGLAQVGHEIDRKSTRLNSSHLVISYAVFCLKKQERLAFFSNESKLLEAQCLRIRTQYYVEMMAEDVYFNSIENYKHHTD